jgi:hypothetical protein
MPPVLTPGGLACQTGIHCGTKFLSNYRKNTRPGRTNPDAQDIAHVSVFEIPGPSFLKGSA